MKLKDFNKADRWPIGLGMGKIEYEEFAAFMLNNHIDNNATFDTPLQYKFNHYEMVRDGWLNDCSENKYTLTKKAIGLLYGMFGKD